MSADEVIFTQYFSRMALVTEGASLPETRGESDLTFSQNDKLDLVVRNLEDVQVQVCIGERSGGDKVIYTQTHSLSQGEMRLELGSFKPNPYVVRVGVSNTFG